MKRLLGFLLLLFSAAALGQTTVLGTIVDPNSNPYVNGTVVATTVVNTGQVSASTSPIALNSSGAFSMTLNAGTYTFTICGTPLNLGPLVKPPPTQICFVTPPLAILGSSQDISAQANSVAAVLGPKLSASSGGTPGTPSGSLQGNCSSAFCAVPNSSFNISTGVVTFPGVQVTPNLNVSDSNGNSITSSGVGNLAWADSGGDGCSGTDGNMKCTDANGDFYEVSDGVFHMNTVTGSFIELTGSQYLFNDGTATFSGTGGVATVPNFVVSSLTTGTNPICPNGPGGKLVNTGCNAGAFPPGNQGLRLSNTTGSTTYAATSLAGGIDASVFTSGSVGACVPGTNDDACIANAIAAIPGDPGSTGGYATIDATGIGNQVWTANPWASFLSNGTTNITGPKKCGKLLLSGGSNIALNAPITVPRCWDVEVVSRFGQSATITASSSWPGIYSTPACITAGGTTCTVTTSAPSLISSGQYQFTVTGQGTSFMGNVVVGEEFGVCQGSNNPGANGPSCGGNGTTTCSAACGTNGAGQLTYGIVLAVTDNTHLIVGTPNSSTGAANATGVNFVIKAPLIWLGAMGADGGDSGGASATWTGGTISCANKPGCTAFTNFSEQENASITHVVIDNVIDTYLDIEGINAVNSGPFDRMVMNASSSCTSATRAIITRIPGSLHPIENTTINFDGCATGAGEVAVDFEEGGDFGPGIHFEGNNTATNIVMDVGENSGGVPMTACPVYCPQPVNIAAGAHIHDLAVTGTGQTCINIGSNAATQIETENTTCSFTNVIADNARSCNITSATGDSTISRYDHLYNNGYFGTAQNIANSCGSGGTFPGTLTFKGTTSGSATIGASATGSLLDLNGANATVSAGGALTVTSCSGCGGGGGTGAQHSTAIYNPANTLVSAGPGIAGQTYTSNGGSADPAFISPGLTDSTNSPVTSTPYTIACDSGTTIIDRAHPLRFQSGASVITVPLSTGSGCAGLATWLYDDNAGTLTVNRSSTDTFTVFTGTAATDGATSFTLLTGQTARLAQGASGIWEVTIYSGSGSSGNRTILTKTANYTTVAADFSASAVAPTEVIYTISSATTVTHTLPNATTGISTGGYQVVKNSCSSGWGLYVTPATLTLDGSATVSLFLPPCHELIVTFDGSNFRSDLGQPNTSAVGGFVSPYGTPTSGLSSASVLQANKAEGYAFFIPQPVTITKLHIYVTTGVAASTGDVGIYDQGGNLITHTGSQATATSATALHTNAGTAITLAPGVYVVAICDSANTVTFPMVNLSSTFTNVLGTTSGLIGPQQETTAGCTAGVLPATVVWAQSTSLNGVPIVGMTP